MTKENLFLTELAELLKKHGATFDIYENSHEATLTFDIIQGNYRTYENEMFSGYGADLYDIGHQKIDELIKKKEEK